MNWGIKVNLIVKPSSKESIKIDIPTHIYSSLTSTYCYKQWFYAGIFALEMKDKDQWATSLTWAT